jgi:hypothetical protein
VWNESDRYSLSRQLNQHELIGLPNKSLIIFIYISVDAFWEYTLFRDVENCGISSIQFLESGSPQFQEFPNSVPSNTRNSWNQFTIPSNSGQTQLPEFLFAVTLMLCGVVKVWGPDWVSNSRMEFLELGQSGVGRNWFCDVQHCGIGWLLCIFLWYNLRIQPCYTKKIWPNPVIKWIWHIMA